MTLLTPELFFSAGGCFLLVLAFRVAREHLRRPLTQKDPAAGWKAVTTVLFWTLLGLTFIVGKRVSPEVIGAAVIMMVLLAATGGVVAAPRREEDLTARAERSQRFGNRLLAPTVIIPAVVVVGGLTLARFRWENFSLVDPKNVTQVALGLGCSAGLWSALRITRAPAAVAVDEGGRLLRAMGWALILPQMLAALGGIFAKAGVGEVLARGVSSVIPTHYAFVAVLAYCAGMALFTMVMGNAFAAFPVITIGIGLPFVVQLHGGNPAIMASFGMLSGYCGTLLTPMAANFNLVPAILLEIEDPNAVIKAQAPFAVALWCFNVLAMWLLVFRF